VVEMILSNDSSPMKNKVITTKENYFCLWLHLTMKMKGLIIWHVGGHKVVHIERA